MSMFNDEERMFLQQAISIYLQVVQQKLPQTEFEAQYALAQQVAEKVEGAQDSAGAPSGKPRGISDEWYDNCCAQCDKLAPGGKCLDKITEKFPGKCDPIIKYEREKNRAG